MMRSIPWAACVAALLLVLVASGIADDKPEKKESSSSKPTEKTDLEQLQGEWRLDLKLAGKDYVVRLRFREGGEGGFQFLRPDPAGNLTEGTGDKAEKFGGAIFAGLSYKLIERDGKRLISMKDCICFPDKTTELIYQFKDGVLCIKPGKVKFKVGDDKEITLDLSGTWKRLK